MSTAVIDLPALPALVEGSVGHTRRAQVERSFTYHVYQWLVDVDQLPRQPWWLRPFAGFSAGDHLGAPDLSIRENVESFCAGRDVDVTGGRIVMLANARILGHTFDPLSVFWCLDDDGGLRCIVAEVHNTYGQRHAYLLRPDAAGRATTPKEFYVSPFFTVDGGYDLQFKLGPGLVSSSVVLRQDGRSVFSAVFRGTPVRATPRRLGRLLVTKPLMTHQVSLLIRIQGVRLWLRRVPVVRRPRRHHQEGVS